MSEEKPVNRVEFDILVLHADALLMPEERFSTRLESERSSFDLPLRTTLTYHRVSTSELDRWQELVVEEAGGWEHKFGMVGLSDWRERLKETIELFDRVVLLGQKEDTHAINRIARHLRLSGKRHWICICDFEWHEGDWGIGIAEGVNKVAKKMVSRYPIANLHVWLRLNREVVDTVRDRLAWRTEENFQVRELDRGLGLLRGNLTQDLYLRRYQRTAMDDSGGGHD